MEVNNTTSRQEHWWFLMRQRASGTVNPEMKKNNIYMFSQIFSFLFLLYKCQKRISWWCPSRFRFRTSPCYLMVVLLPSWGKNKCRALWHLAEGNIGGAALDIAHYKEFTNHMFENTATSPMGKMCWTDPSDLCDAASILNSLSPSDAYMHR